MVTSETDRAADDPARLTGVVYRNIQAILEVKKAFEAGKSRRDRVADVVARFCGTLTFVGIHGLVVLIWIVSNLGLIPGLRPFDPFPFGLLAMVASVEAILLTTFVLNSQNRMAKLEDQRADLDLQISLLAEHEVTHVIELLDALAAHLGADATKTKKSEELRRDVDPQVLVKEIERVEKGGKT